MNYTKKIAISAAMVSMIAAPGFAQSFRADNRVQVTAVAGGFQVAGGGGYGARGMWCAAADYAKDVLKARGVSRIYVHTPAQPGGQAVFTTDPTGLTPQAVVITAFSVTQPGANLSVDHALAFCADARLSSR